MSLDPEMLEILNIFFEESNEGLNAMESGLLALQNGAGKKTIDTIFRAAHSVKGGAGTFGFIPITDFTHAVETLLDEMRTGKRAATAESIQVLLQSVDVIRDMMSLAQAERPIVSDASAALTERFTQLLNEKPTIPPPAPVNTMQPVANSTRWRIEFKPHPTLLQTCNDPLRMFRQLANIGRLDVVAASDRLPSLAQLDATQCYLTWSLIVSGAASQTELAEVFEWVNANSSICYEQLSESTASIAAVATPRTDPAQPVLGETAVAHRTTPADTPASSPSARLSAESGSIRVGTEKVDALIDLVGELVITQSLLGRYADPFDATDLEALRRGLANLARNTRELQESVLKIRMLPISVSFNRFPRLVHELSRKLGKKVDLKLNGESTELDKTVLEKIGDPLVHLVRNSLDHGLETPAARVLAGKSEVGTLELNAYHEGGSVIIEVRDDGAGLNRERILAKARERGLVAPDTVLSADQVHELIFLPGFSTADAVSDLSGRGVGMDVVKRNIADLGGQVQISSVPSKGSLIRVRLPLTLAILEGQMLRVGKETYFVSLVSIIETVQPNAKDIHTVAGRKELFKHRADYLPIIRLHEAFQITPDSTQIERGLLIVVESDGRRVAILVDELLAQQQVVIKSLETNFKQVSGLAGATIHGDGTVALILDVPSLIERFANRAVTTTELAA